MSLIISISGIRGTVGPGDNNLNPRNLVEFVSAFVQFLKTRSKNKKRLKIVVGRDGRASGEVFLNLTINIILSMGVDVLNVDLATTPTVEMAVILEGADAGIIITASHNPAEWNALKFLNNQGEFISKNDGRAILEIIKNKKINFVDGANFGKLEENFSYHNKHIDLILKDPLIVRDKIKKANFRVVVDGINSVGAKVMPELLKNLGVQDIKIINDKIDGKFNHNPEPIEKNLKQLGVEVKKYRADVGLAVDPDVDRLAMVDNLGQPMGEEYTLVMTADYVFKNFIKLKNKFKKNSVSNLSSSSALEDLTKTYQGKYFSSAVGEINVVQKMKQAKAVIGGEGNGGVIYPNLHYGRDALIGTALILSYLASEKKSCVELKKGLPDYYIIKHKIKLNSEVKINQIFAKIERAYQGEKNIKIDGLKIVFKKDKAWIHLRSSNTEPIIRLYCEAKNKKEAQKILNNIINDFINI